MAPLRHGLDIKATVFTWSITTDIRANLLSARFSKRAPAATRILFSACCRDHDDTGATELTDRICRVRRPVDIPAPRRLQTLRLALHERNRITGAQGT